MRYTFFVPVLTIALGVQASSAQTVNDWLVFSDAESTSVCDVVNAFDNELVLLTATNQLVLVTGTDTVLLDTFVDLNNAVFFEGSPNGFIEFAEDGDGFRTLWWLTLDGRVVQLDPFDAEPSASNSFPSDFIDVPCDACRFLDQPPTDVCPPDADNDGLSDEDEIAIGSDPGNPDTDGDGLDDGLEVDFGSDPLDDDTDGDGLDDSEEVLELGTDPTQVDTDNDGIDDGTEVLVFETDPLDEDTDSDGIPDRDDDEPLIATIGGSPVTVEICGTGVGSSLFLTMGLVGFVGLLSSRRL